MTSGNLKRKPEDPHENRMNSDSDLNFEMNKKFRMIQTNQFLLAFHLVTCGLQNNDLGRDETAILQIGFQLIDVANKQVIGGKLILLQASSLLDPSADPEKIHISVPAREMTELLNSPNSNSVVNLQQALDEIDIFISENISKLDDQSIEIIPVTIGHLPLRSVLHRETRFRDIRLNSYWYHFYDVCDQISTFCNIAVHNLNEIADAIQLNKLNGSSSNILWGMTAAIHHLILSGHVFHSMQTIKCGYKPIVFHVDDNIEPDVVVMIKPIDYRTPISQIIPFFQGLNIADGGIAVVMSEGRRSNKILVKFEDKRQRDICLLRDKHHIEPGNTRFITISIFESNDFMKIAGYRDENVKIYLQKITDQDQILVRIKGLPYTVTKTDILNFFVSNDVDIQFSYDGIFLVQKPSGELNGDAFVIFENESLAQKAKNLKGMTIGNRYMEIFYSTPPEMNQVIAAASIGTGKAKPTKSSMKKHETLNGDLLRTTPISDNTLVGTVTKFIPAEATDSDFIKYLAEYRSLCLKISRCNLNSSTSFVSYIALFKNSSDAEIVVKALSNKPFKIEQTKTEVSVETIEFPLLNKLEKKQNIIPQIIPKVVTNNLPFHYLNLLPNVSPYSSLALPQSINIPNSLSMAALNGSFLNYGGIPNVYTGNPSLNLMPNSNLLMVNQLNSPMFLGSASNLKFGANSELLINSMNLNNSWPDYRQMMPLSYSSVNKSNVLLMSGVMIKLVQQDLDSIFSSIASNISMLPKLVQNNQFSYAVFNCSEDANIALQRCPIILYNNQVIQLISANV